MDKILPFVDSKKTYDELAEIASKELDPKLCRQLTKDQTNMI